MKIALMGDIHGNLLALQAVVQHAESIGCERIFNLGDSVGYGAFPEETVRFLRKRGIAGVVGNYDRKVLKFPKKREKWRRTKAKLKYTAFEFAYKSLSERSRNYLAYLPADIRIVCGGKRLLMVHGSPAAADESLRDDTPLERLIELSKTSEADIVACAHSHRPFKRKVAGVWFVNTGSVGMPDDGDPRACYLVLDIRAGYFRIVQQRVPYDTDKAATGVRDAGMPEEFAQMVVRGQSLEELTRSR